MCTGGCNDTVGEWEENREKKDKNQQSHICVTTTG